MAEIPHIIRGWQSLRRGNFMNTSEFSRTTFLPLILLFVLLLGRNRRMIPEQYEREQLGYKSRDFYRPRSFPWFSAPLLFQFRIFRPIVRVVESALSNILDSHRPVYPKSLHRREQLWSRVYAASPSVLGLFNQHVPVQMHRR